VNLVEYSWNRGSTNETSTLDRVEWSNSLISAGTLNVANNRRWLLFNAFACIYSLVHVGLPLLRRSHGSPLVHTAGQMHQNWHDTALSLFYRDRAHLDVVKWFVVLVHFGIFYIVNDVQAAIRLAEDTITPIYISTSLRL
jgi:hypothetical protein